MNKIHVLNIGYPKCGTTWLWQNLKIQPWFSCPTEKENKKLISGNQLITEYVRDYNNFDITANFATNMFSADRYLIQQLQEIGSTRVSIVYRNPYDLYWSMFNFVRHDAQSFNEYVSRLLSGGWFNRFDQILLRWQQVFPDVHVFFYDDIVANQGYFLSDYCHRLGLPACVTSSEDRINVTRYTKTDFCDLSVETCNSINDSIEKLQLLVDKDILHWRRL